MTAYSARHSRAAGVSRLASGHDPSTLFAMAEERQYATFTFGDFALDESCFELRRRGKPVAIEPKVLRLLMFLIGHRSRVVSRSELLAALWPNQTVTDAS